MADFQAEPFKNTTWSSTKSTTPNFVIYNDYSQNNQIPTIFVGSMVNPGQYSETINHYTILRTLEDMYGLPYAGNDATATPITDSWQ